MKDEQALANKRSLKRGSIVFLVVWASGVGIFALEWFGFLSASLGSIFFGLVIAVMALAIASISKTVQVYKQRRHEQDKQ